MDIYTESNNKRSFENNGKYSESTRVAINHILWNKKILNRRKSWPHITPRCSKVYTDLVITYCTFSSGIKILTLANQILLPFLRFRLKILRTIIFVTQIMGI